MSRNTPYNGLLIFHGLGVGKTCASIAIAETLRPTVLANNQKIISLHHGSLQMLDDNLNDHETNL